MSGVSQCGRVTCESGDRRGRKVTVAPRIGCPSSAIGLLLVMILILTGLMLRTLKHFILAGG